MSSILNLIASDKNILIYRPEFRQITDSVTAAILLGQIIYWHQKYNGNEFYKFKEPCNHSMYKSGTSWVEELAFSRKEFDAAYKKLEEKGFVSKRTTMERVTFYSINSETLSKALNGIYLKPKRDVMESPKGTLLKSKRDVMESPKGTLLLYTETTNRDYLRDYPTETTSESTNPAREDSHAEHVHVSQNSESSISEKQKTANPSQPKKTKSTLNAGWLVEQHGVNPQVAADWLTIRKVKRAPLTQTAMNAVERESAKAGISISQAIEFACEAGWVGFKADWYADRMFASGSVASTGNHIAPSAANFQPRSASTAETIAQRAARLAARAEQHSGQMAKDVTPQNSNSEFLAYAGD